MIYGIATNHPAFRGFLPTILSVPFVSYISEFIYPGFDIDTSRTLAFKPVDARALGGLVWTLLFGLRAYNIHWSGASETKPAGKKNGKKLTGKTQ